MVTVAEIKKGGGTYQSALAAIHDASGVDYENLKKRVDALFGADNATAQRAGVAKNMSILRQQIDAGEITSVGQLYDIALPLVGDKVAELETYLREGGIAGKLTDSTLIGVFKAVTQKDPTKHAAVGETYLKVREFVEAEVIRTGVIPNNEQLHKLVTRAWTEGERAAGGFGYGDDVKYYEAVKQGRDHTWLPDEDTLTSEEKEQAEVALKAEGEPITSFTLRLWKRDQMGLPITEALWNRLQTEKENAR